MRVRFLIILTLFSYRIVGQSIDPFKKSFEKIIQQRIDLKVKTQRVYYYAVNKNGKIAKKGQLRSEAIYNKWGKPIRSSIYLPDMTIINESEYDEKGREIKMTIKDSQGQIRQILYYEYNEKNMIVKTKYYDKNGALTSIKDRSEDNSSVSSNDQGTPTSMTASKYDSTERSYSSVLLTPSGQLKYQNKYFFNDSEQVILLSVIDNVQNKRFETKFVYDSKGNRIQENEFSINGMPTRKVVYTYNEKNLQTESVTFGPYDKKKLILKYEYEFY